MMRKNKFAQNLRAYRKMYGLIGQDLATEIEFGSAPTISQYETGKRYPEEEIIIRIANFFRITVDELLYGDPPEVCFYKLPLDDERAIIEMSKVGLPIYEVPEAELKNNPLLQKAYEKHKHMTNRYYAGGYWSENEFSECFGMYVNSYENEETVGAAANLLWFNSLMLFVSKIGAVDKLNDLSDAIDAMTEKRKSVKTFLRDYALSSEYYEEECDKKLFTSIVHAILDDTYKEENVERKLKLEYEKFIRRL